MNDTSGHRSQPKFHLIHDHFQNFKPYAIPRAQLVIADIPYNIGKNAHASNPDWYIDGDNVSATTYQSGSAVMSRLS